MCDSPILAWRDYDGSINLYCKLADYVPQKYSANPSNQWLLLPCGKCFSCRLSLARMWSMRCMYELQSHKESCMLTLTYNDKYLPDGGNLCKPDYQNFFKRLRKRLSPLKLRYYGCGEYGDKYGRPHYHFIVFGWCPPDKKLFYIKDGIPVYKSEFVQGIWPEGFVTVSDVCERSLKYVCRYVLKKVDWDPPRENMVPMFTCCSSRPAIGYDWFLQNGAKILAKDENGDIVRYGYPDLWNPGHYLDIRYYRKLIQRLGDGVPARERVNKKTGEKVFIPAIPPNPFFHELDLDIDCFFAMQRSGRKLFTTDELLRLQNFSKARLSHNTHYGRVLSGEVMEKMQNG